jgi:hypothetical protein
MNQWQVPICHVLSNTTQRKGASGVFARPRPPAHGLSSPPSAVVAIIGVSALLPAPASTSSTPLAAGTEPQNWQHSSADRNPRGPSARRDRGRRSLAVKDINAPMPGSKISAVTHELGRYTPPTSRRSPRRRFASVSVITVPHRQAFRRHHHGRSLEPASAISGAEAAPADFSNYADNGYY